MMIADYLHRLDAAYAASPSVSPAGPSGATAPDWTDLGRDHRAMAWAAFGHALGAALRRRFGTAGRGTAVEARAQGA